MQKNELKTFYTICSLQKHEQIKDKLLDLINSAESEHVVAEAAETDITRADWHDGQNNDREWVKYFSKTLTQHMSHQLRTLGYHGHHINELWFQQYKNSSGHGWHIHSSNFTNVYYLQFPEGSPKTQIISPWDQKTIIELDVKEGDIVTFPSFVIHRGPPNISDQTKTIISWNLDVWYPDSQYGKNLVV